MGEGHLKKEDHRSLLDYHREARDEPWEWATKCGCWSHGRLERPLSFVGDWSGWWWNNYQRVDQWFLNLDEHPTHLEGTWKIQIHRPLVGPSESTLQWSVGLKNEFFIGGSEEASPQISIHEPHVGDERWDLGHTGRGSMAKEFSWYFSFSPFNFVFRIEETWTLFPGPGGNNLIEDTRETGGRRPSAPLERSAVSKRGGSPRQVGEEQLEEMQGNRRRKLKWKFEEVKGNASLLKLTPSPA